MTAVTPWLMEQPFTSERRVRWGECDPAGVVYTPRFGDYVAEAFHTFMESLLGDPLSRKMPELDLGTPVKSLQFVFHRSLWHDDEFRISTLGGDIRNRSFDLAMEAHDTGGRHVFSARLGIICVHTVQRESQAIPQALKERLQLYAARFPAPVAA